MKKIICLWMSLCVLLSLAAILPAAAAPAQESTMWATVSYRYDPVDENDVPESVLVSLAAAGASSQPKTYLQRAATVTWQADEANLKVNGVLQEGVSIHLEKAGKYDITVIHKETGEYWLGTLIVLPVIKLGETTVGFDNDLAKFQDLICTYYPVVECLNVDSMALDEGMASYDKNFQSGTTITQMGRHTLKMVSNNQVYSLTFYVSACTAQKVYDTESGLHTLELTVGEFPEQPDVILDGDKNLGPGVHRVTAVGQHTLTAALNGTPITAMGALPDAQTLNLQVVVVLPKTTVDEPVSLRLSVWDADFYVDGEKIEGDYRLEKSGEHEFVVKDANGNVVENAFLLRVSEADEGTTYTTLTLRFDNPHNTYVIFFIIVAVLLIAAAVFFFLQRRRIV
ncbi:MAG: hypothetical protein E7624_05455 [Ruminococcaceae bacterium]|nr:hypothetical protein [Oscillospiraceae bacterium]